MDPRYILGQVTDALVVVDHTGTIVLFNHAAEELFGYGSDEIVGSSVEQLVPTDVRRRHDGLLAGFIASGGGRRLMAPDRGFVEGVRRDGSRFPAAITVGPIDLGTEEKLAMAAVRNESAVVEANARLLEASDELAARNNELEQFLLSASHDLREPLRKVRSFSEQLKVALGDELDEWAALCLDRTLNAGHRMSVLLDELIGYARLTLRDRVRASCVLSEIVGEALDDLSLRMEETGASIDVGALPELDGDRVLLRQLFHNLIGNALKFSRPELAPMIGVHEAAHEDGMVVIHVDDEGIGIESGYEERAFEPFRRVHASADVEGTGMGLTISRKIAELHGGTVTASPNPAGAGARMTVKLARSVDHREEGRCPLG